MYMYVYRLLYICIYFLYFLYFRMGSRFITRERSIFGHMYVFQYLYCVCVSIFVLLVCWVLGFCILVVLSELDSVQAC